ncbi:MAG: sugar ABC transporter ATP-binding protein [Eubacteriales bacterium]
MRKEVFRMERVTYKELDIKKLDYCNLHIFEGEILGFLPVNSYGLSHFIKILKTNLPLYDGYIYLNDRQVNSWKQSNKQTNRVTVIENQSCLVGDLTVCDNIFVLRQNFRQEIISDILLWRQLEPFLKELNLSIPPDLPAEKLTAFERIVVEILKGVVASHRLIVLEEVQNLITDSELLKLHEIIRFYSKKGISFLYIAVHFENILQICHRAAFFQNGRITKVLQPDQLSMDNLIISIEDYQTIVKQYVQNKDLAQAKPHFHVHHNFPTANVCLDIVVKESECVVIQCQDDHMHHHLLDTLSRGTMEAGSFVALDEKIIQPRDRQIAIINERPAQTMLFPEMTYMDNLCFGLERRIHGIWNRSAIRKSIQKEYAPDLGDVFHTHVLDLTEKEKYALVYTRILLQKPKVVVCIQPFKGADLELRMYIFALLEQLVNKGISVIILSINLADALSIADRFVLLEPGKPQTEYLREDFKDVNAVAPWKTIKDE